MRFPYTSESTVKQIVKNYFGGRNAINEQDALRLIEEISEQVNRDNLAEYRKRGGSDE